MVDEWMQPQQMVRGMDKALERAEKEEEKIFEFFFSEDLSDQVDMGYDVKYHVKDQVSKDLHIPWHQIGPEQIQIWRNRGFEPVDYLEWGRIPMTRRKEDDEDVEWCCTSKRLGGYQEADDLAWRPKSTTQASRTA
jgi:hypothetical protein